MAEGVNNFDLSALVSGGKFTLKKKEKALSDFPKRSKNITFGSKDGRQIGGL